ncbi:MAG TPA: glycosyltransferase 87 family protein [Bradyrhizobium sp.]|nr:glycosyltransferase 87 family protein [Bradyrhizobium sp.]
MRTSNRAAIVTIAALAAASFAILGGGVWHAFADSMNFTQTVVLEQGGTGWEKIQSIFSAVRNWGGNVATAYAVQARWSCCSPQASPGCGTATPPSN